jgi:hypothetical protein
MLLKQAAASIFQAHGINRGLSAARSMDRYDRSGYGNPHSVNQRSPSARAALTIHLREPKVQRTIGGLNAIASAADEPGTKLKRR